MSRVNFNVGQEVIFEDLNRLQALLQQEMYDRVISPIIDNQQGFFDDSFEVIFKNATEVTIRSGVGIQEDLSVGIDEPTRRLLFHSAIEDKSITAPDGANARIDLVVAKAELADTLSQDRKKKVGIDGDVVTENMVVKRDWQADIQIVAGTPAGSPSEPSVPSGFVRVAAIAVAAVSGISGSGDITDQREIIQAGEDAPITTTNFQVVTQALSLALKTLLKELDDAAAKNYDAYVGAVAEGSIATHATLQEAIDDQAGPARILVMESVALTAKVNVNKAGLEIHFRPGVIYSQGAGAPSIGLDISAIADRLKIVGGRFEGFSGGGEKGINVNNGVSFVMLRDLRGANNTKLIEDNGNITLSSSGNIEE